MKKLFLFILLIPSLSFAQMSSCCVSANASQKFNELASSETFALSHAAPLPFIFESDKGKMITFACADGVLGNAFEIKSAKESDVWLLVFHEWWGLNDYIKQEAEKYYNAIPNINVLAIDLYDGIVVETPEEAKKTMQEVKEDRARSIITGAMEYAGKKAKFGTLGWCFGGMWSLQTSLMAGKKAEACVMYYGMPETDVKKLKKINCDVLGIFGTKDNFITPEIVATFKKNMQEAGKQITVKSYKADHAFANPSNPEHDSVATASAYKMSLAFLKMRLK